MGVFLYLLQPRGGVRICIYFDNKSSSHCAITWRIRYAYDTIMGGEFLSMQMRFFWKRNTNTIQCDQDLNVPSTLTSEYDHCRR